MGGAPRGGRLKWELSYNNNMRSKKTTLITQVDCFKLHQEIPELDYGIIVNFEKVDGEWMVDIKDDDGSSRFGINELKEIINENS